eukprot:TRINITY_DN63743_c0_g1_i1.p1 TRINITY_DN63743_c0_g1~~TRINITY_DN63743_c0_g1_i1.p1  ORF type:complete len:878 (-),score=123.01 TRINITY_DN63743_c0_g1_i1:60-2693(-)
MLLPLPLPPQHLTLRLVFLLVLLLITQVATATGTISAASAAIFRSRRSFLRPWVATHKHVAVESVDAIARDLWNDDVKRAVRPPNLHRRIDFPHHTVLTTLHRPAEHQERERQGQHLHERDDRGTNSSMSDGRLTNDDNQSFGHDNTSDIEDEADEVLAEAARAEARFIGAAGVGSANGRKFGAASGVFGGSDQTADSSKTEASVDFHRRRRGFRESAANIAAQRIRQRTIERLGSLVAKQTRSDALASMLGSIRKDLYHTTMRLNGLKQKLENGVSLEEMDGEAQLVYPLSTCLRCIFVLSAIYMLVYTATAVVSGVADIFNLGPRSECADTLRAAGDTVFYVPMISVLFLGAQLRALEVSQGQRGPQDWAEFGMQVCTWSVVVQTGAVLVASFFTNNVALVAGHFGCTMRDLSSKANLAEDMALASFLSVIRYAAMVSMYSGVAVVCFQVAVMDTKTLRVSPEDIWDNPATAEAEYAPPVSSTMRCTMVLTLVFMIVHLAYAATRSYGELTRRGEISVDAEVDEKNNTMQLRSLMAVLKQALQPCAEAINVAPMMCILFLTARMRAVQLDPQYGNHQWWMEVCLYACTFGVVAQVFSVGCAGLSVATAVGMERGDYEDDLDEILDMSAAHHSFGGAVAQPFANDSMIWTGGITLRCIAIVVVYGSALAVVLGVLLMQAPPMVPSPTLATSKPVPPTPPEMSATVGCVLLLASLYLCFWLCLFVVHMVATLPAFVDNHRTVGLALGVFFDGIHTVRLCPVMAVLFLGAHMRALTLNHGQSGSQQCWALNSMYVASLALVLKLIIVLLVGATLPSSKRDKGASTSALAKNLLVTIEVFVSLALYGGALMVVVSVLTIRSETASCAQRSFSSVIYSFL